MSVSTFHGSASSHQLQTPWWRLRGLAVAGLLLVAMRAPAESPVLQQRLELPDGEILIGSLLSEDETTYVFRSQSLGELHVQKEGAHLSLVAPPGAGMPERSPAWALAHPVPAGPAAPKVAAASPAPAPWKRSFEAGYSYQARGNQMSDTETYVRAEIVRETPGSLVGLHARFLFGEQNGVHNTDKFDAGVKFHYDCGSWVVLRDDFNYSYDRLTQLDHEFEENAGFNVILAKGPRFRYSVGPGVALQYTETTDNQTSYKMLGDFSQEFSWQISERIKVTNIASYLYKPENWADYRLRAFSALIAKVSEHITLNVRYEYEFEALRPVADGRSDNRVFTTVGYTF